MALINTLRNKMGKVVVGMVAFAILSFILADLLGPNSLFTGTDNNVGEIAGESISYIEYQSQVEQFAANYAANFGRNPSEREMVTIRNQAWEMLIVERAFENEYNNLGLTVTEEELVDLVQGKNISPDILSAPIFANQQTGQFDRQLLVDFLASFNQQPAQLQSQWYAFESNLRPARIRTKFEYLLNSSNYITEEEARELYLRQASSADINYVFVPFTSVQDSLVEISDAELEKHLKDNSDDFQTDASKTFKYVKFDVNPSEEDSAYFRSELEELLEDFERVEDDSIFARINSDGFGFYNNYSIKLLNNYLQGKLDELEEGKVYGPHQEGGSFKIYKVVKIEDDTTSSAKASHILFKWEEETPAGKSVARQEATRVLNEIKGGADFAEMARQYGTDGTANIGGDLGWFETGGMVKPFQDAVFNARNEGLLNNVVETEFGYHIIDVTGVKTNKKYTVATIERTIVASDITQDKAFRKADYFAGTNSSYVEFLESAEVDSLQILEASNIKVDQSDVTGIGNARQIVRWVYNDASKNQVSDVFEIEDSYIVVVLTDETEEGTSSLDNVRFQVERLVRNNKKAEYIISQLSMLSGSPEEIATGFGEGASTYSMASLSGEATAMDNLGTVPEAVGAVFGMQAGQTSEPMQTPTGVVIIQVNNITTAAEIGDYSAYKEQLANNRNGRSSYNLSEAVKKAAKIKDERHRFY